MTLYPGQIINQRFRIIGLISSGGFSEVYKALQLNLHRFVAIKVFTGLTYKDISEMRTIAPSELYDSIGANEIHCMLKARIPGVPQLYDVLDFGSTMAIVMEYFPGTNLMEWVSSHGAIPNDQAIDFAIQLCQIIENLHRNTIVHCDIKPNNMIISPDSKTLSLLDLGLSRIIDRHEIVTLLGRTDGYSPPEFYSQHYYEQLNNSFHSMNCTSIAYQPQEALSLSGTAGQTADIYSIGATLYYLLTGCHPCYNHTDFSAITNPQIRNIVRRAMSENADDRYFSVADLRKSISQLNYEYDVALSYAGEDRHYVEQVAAILKAHKVRVFYDHDEVVNTWGADMYTTLDDIYRNKARYCVMFISKYYRDKMWTNHERCSALDRALNSSNTYILPARFDDSDILGIRTTTAYIDLRTTSPEKLADLIIRKLNS